MKKFLYLALCLLLVLAMTFTFVACGEDTETDDGNDGSSTTTPTTGSTDNKPSDSTGSTEPLPPPHEHTFEDVLSYDDDVHFYKATCEHEDERSEVAPHSFDLFGNCVCGYATEADINKALEAIVANWDKVENGTIIKAVDYAGTATTTYEYAFFDNFVYIKENGDYVNEYYYAVDSKGAVFGVTTQGSFVNRDNEAYEGNMKGPKFDYIFAGDEESVTFGVEEMITFLYEMASTSDNFVATYEEGMFVFGCTNRVLDDWMNYFYVTAVSFTVNPDTLILENATVVVQRYSQESYTEVEEGVFELNENATPNSVTSFIINQTTEAGEAMENPYDPSVVVVDSFVIRDANGNDIEEGTINIAAGGQVKFYFKDIAPETALFKLCTIDLYIENNETGMSPSYWPYFNSYDNSYSFTLSTPGTYTMTVTVDGMEVVSTIEVALKTPTTIAAQVYDNELGAFKKTNKVEIFAGAPLYFMSYVEADYNGAYVAEIVGDATGAKIESGEIDEILSSVFTAEAAGTYKIKLTSTVVTSLTSELTVVVKEAPSLDSLLSGSYIGVDEFGLTPVSVEFDGAKVATVVYTDVILGDLTATLTFTTENGLEYTLSGDDFVEDFYVSENYDLVIVIDGEEFVLEAVAKELLATGTIVIEDVINNGRNSATYTFELDSNNKFTFFKAGVATTEIEIIDNGDSYSIKHPGLGMAQTLQRTSNEESGLAGTYKVEMNLGSTMHISNVTITVDAEEQPVKESTTGTLVVEHLDNNGKYSGTYTYEIVDGAFVFYKDGEVTTNVTLSGADGDYMFKFQGVGSAQALQKTDGAEGELAGTYKCAMKLGATEFHIANVTITPDPIVEEEEGELTTGTITVVDNNNGAIAGTYLYEIVDGAFVIYKDGAVSDAMIIGIAMDGSYTFQCTSVPKPQTLVKVEGEEGVLAGKYNVNFVMNGIFVLTFTPGEVDIPSVGGDEEEETITGTIDVKDNNNGKVTGTYTFEYANGAFTIYKDGEVTDTIIIGIDLGGNYTFQCAGLPQPQALVKVEGEDGELAGKYNVNFISSGIYVVTFTVGEGGNGGNEGDDGEDPVVEDTELVLGDNAVSVPAGGWGTDIPFTSEEGGKFTISAAAGETNAALTIFLADGTAEMITLPYTFEVAAGETVTFNVCPDNYAEDVINLVIAVAVEEEEGGNEGGSATDGTYFAEHENGTTVTMVFTNTTATSGEIFLTRTTSWGSTQEVYMTYTVDNGAVTLAGANGSSVPYGAVLTVAADGTPLTYTYSGATYELVKQ